MRPDLLEQAFARTGARVFYAQPTYANPHGAVLAPERRAQVLEIAVAAGAFIVEDEAFRDMTLEGPEPPPPLLHGDADGHVVHLRSLSKPAAPGLRVSGLVARGPAAARLRAARMVDGTLVPGPLQEAAVELVTAPGWRRHLARTRGVLRERRDALLAAVEAELGPGRAARPRGGMHLWVRLDPGVDDVALAERAARAGVLVSPGRPYFPAEPPGGHLRITFAGEPPDRLAAGVRILAGV